MKTTTLVILAAGMGSRYGGTKQFDPITPFGETILDFSLYDALRAGFGKVVFVVRRSILSEAKRVFDGKLKGRADVRYVCQDKHDAPGREKPRGTAHAILTAREEVAENFCVINADDFYGRSAFEQMSSNRAPGFSMMGFRLGSTLSPNGPVSRGLCIVNSDGNLEEIIERTGIVEQNGAIISDDSGDSVLRVSSDAIVSLNLWGFDADVFDLLENRFEVFLESSAADPEAEFFITDVVNYAVNCGEASVKVLLTNEEWVGVTYRKDRKIAAERIKDLREKGVYPRELW